MNSLRESARLLRSDMFLRNAICPAGRVGIHIISLQPKAEISHSKNISHLQSEYIARRPVSALSFSRSARHTDPRTPGSVTVNGEPDFLPGDVNLDGDITMKDVLRARRIIAGLD